MIALKEYFTDGLLKIAVVLSLLRTDIDISFRVRYDQYQALHPEPQSLYYGPLLGYAQDFRPLGSYLEYNDIAPLKSVGLSRNIALCDIHSLVEYRRFDGAQTNLLATWLVDGSEPQLPVQQFPELPDLIVPTQPGRVELASPAPEPSLEEIDVGFSAFFGNELTKEDMDLIDILWRQDMDLGISRDVFNSAPHSLHLRELLEQKDEVNATEEFTKVEEPLQESFPPANQTGRFIVDDETGECLPIGPSTPIVSMADVTELFQQISPESLDQEFNYLPTEPLNALNISDTLPYLDPIEEFLAAEEAAHAATSSNYQPVEQITPPSSLEQGWQDVLSLLDDPTLFDLKQPLCEELPLAPSDSASEFSFVASPLTYQQALGVPNSFNFSGDFESLYSPPPGGNYSGGGGVLLRNVSFGSSRQSDGRMMMRNFTLPTTMTQPQFLDAIQTNSSLQTVALSPLFSISMPPTLNLSYDFRMHGNVSDSTFMELDQSAAQVEPILMAEPILVAEPLALGHYPSNDSFIRQFLENDLADLSFDETVNTGVVDFNFEGLNSTWSPDSAISSMTSPTELLLGHPLSAAALPMDGVDQSDDSSDCKQDVKHSELAYYQRYNCSPPPSHNTNSSCSANSSRPLPAQTGASPKHVLHNHTYPLQPGRASREERDAEARREKEERATRSRDIKRAKALRLPLSVDDIVELPVDRFTELLARHALTDAQHQLVRDIRRRGKNKAAAQNCRKRKLEVIQTLEEEVEGLRGQRDALARDKEGLAGDAVALREGLSRLQGELLGTLRDAEGRPYDPRMYTLQRTADGDIILVQRDGATGGGATAADEDEVLRGEEKGERKRRPKRKE